MQAKYQQINKTLQQQFVIEHIRTIKAIRLINKVKILQISKQFAINKIQKQFVVEQTLQQQQIIEILQVSKQAIEQVNKQFAIEQILYQQRVEKLTHVVVIVTFICRRCKNHFNNNIKLYCYIQNRYTKRFIFIAIIFSSKFSTTTLTSKHFATFTRILTFLLTFLLLFTQCLINHVTKSFFCLSLSIKAYFIVQNFYNMFYDKF